jgi:hypothetical protein
LRKTSRNLSEIKSIPLELVQDLFLSVPYNFLKNKISYPSDIPVSSSRFATDENMLNEYRLDYLLT